MHVLTDEREKFIAFAEIPAEDAGEVLCAYHLTPFTDFADHWVVALCDPAYGSFATTWCGDDWRAEPIWDASYANSPEEGRASAKAAAFAYAMGRKES